MRQITILLILLIITVFFCNTLSAQLIVTPQVSPAAVIKQEIGLSWVKISYHRPGVKGREIWGKLVPYGLTTSGFGAGNPMPWRAGANENTTITFTDDAKIEGQPIKAGTYGLFMIVEPEEWTLILSSNSTSWGSFYYDKNEDILRVKLKPQTAEHREWLEYGFDTITFNSVNAYLHWEKIKVSFNIEFDVDNIVIRNIENQLRNKAGFTWQGWNQAAAYCYRSNTFLDKGEEWINKSISINENETNRNMYGYILLAAGKNDEALDVFKENVKKYPDSWNIKDSLGEAYKTLGDKKNAKKYYEAALKAAPENQKDRIKKTLSEL
jgi:tetratricopeptide (TPR) repeat protein